MVEQICHIEHYRRAVRESQSRTLSSQEAAIEWIECYADTLTIALIVRRRPE
jgi:hypothetical protein